MKFKKVSPSTVSLSLAILIITLTLLQACGQAELTPGKLSDSESNCSPDMVQILVGDSYFQNLCGCTGLGENGATYLHPEELYCHVPSQHSFVFFNFLTNKLRHQLVSVGPSFFPGTPLFDPTEEQLNRSWAIQGFPEANSTYTVQDLFVNMTGHFIVP